MAESDNEICETIRACFGSISEQELNAIKLWFDTVFFTDEGCFRADASGAFCPLRAAQMDAYRKVWLEFRKTWNAING